MADIKFMDISENDNPATTDSILVGNKDNGLKRTTLGKLGEMFAVHGLIHIERLDKLVEANTFQYAISAPNVEGYKFAFWLNSASTGWLASTYIDMPYQPNTNIWIVYPNGDDLNAQANGNNSVSAFAVYIKNEVA